MIKDRDIKNSGQTMRKCSTSSQGEISKFWQCRFILIAVRRVIHCDSIQCRWQPLFWFIAGRIETASSIHIMLERCLSTSVLVAVPLDVWNSSDCPPIFFLLVRFNSFPLTPSSYWFALLAHPFLSLYPHDHAIPRRWSSA